MLPGHHSKSFSPQDPSRSVGVGNRRGEHVEDSGSDNEGRDEPSLVQELHHTDELSSFRKKWQRELETSPEHSPHLPSSNRELSERQCNHESIEEKARTFFLKGIQHEQDGKLYEAVQFYRQAVQLVPDIETRLYEASKAKTQQTEVNHELEALSVEEQSSENSGDDDVECDLLLRLQRIYLRDQTICQPDLPHTGAHISSLPMEILLHIMKWIVSSELDLRILDLSCSAVCRGFYLAARDPEIWRLACIRVWGVNCGGLSNFESWRQMYIGRPHIYFHGCYISKTTYIRHGENSFQDQFYRPWHLVEYFRYLRFFPDGLVLMLTTPDGPAVSLRELKHRQPRMPTVLAGHYRLHDDHVIIVLKRGNEKVSSGNNKVRKQRGPALLNDTSEQTFHLELQIAPHRRSQRLLWTGYSVITHRGSNESTTSFDLINGRFPHFYFSRVKSYTSESENILQ